jgi:cobalt-zinc-cadmium resistance protein CzcA
MWSTAFTHGCRCGRHVTPSEGLIRKLSARLIWYRAGLIVRPQVKSVTGVAGSISIGGYVKQYQVQPDASKLIPHCLSFGDVVRAIEATVT